MKIENFIVLNLIKESRKNKDISSSSIIVITVIAAGIIFFISAVSIMNGYIYGLMKISFEIKSFHVDFQADQSIDYAKRTVTRFMKDDRVLFASIYRESRTLLSANGKTTGVVYFRELPEDIFIKDTGLDKTLKLVDGQKSIALNEIMLSQKTAQKLRCKVGDHIFILALGEKDKSKIKLKRLKISGLFSTGFVELDEQLAYVGTETGKTIFDDFIKYDVYIKLKDYMKSTDFVTSQMMLGITGMSTWEETNYNDLTALRFERNIIAFIVILVIFVAILNILTTIYITVLEKRQDIGILKAVGYPPDKITLIFLLNGIYLGVIGIIIGIFGGLFVMSNLNEIIKFFGDIVNFLNSISYNILSLFVNNIEKPEIIEIFSKDFYLDKIYTEISFSEIVLVSMLTLVFSIIASILPAIKAGNIKPVEVIRNG
ncbi:MAG: hypothetical protein A2086_00855 [Spirochaetes bacterium GWD1_27_9]|nr:MAG: hypothetical protein A2Z98_08850 [Spirochaetes bacterium GWB1_27_13]OHD32556.1 MAG: hypothetical protein A2086_00855 [Spirochaetes bacterium GWD1_27_9]